MIHCRSLLAETSLTNALDKRYCSYSLCPYSNIWIFPPLCWTWSNDFKSRFFLFSVSRTSTDFVWVHWFSLQGHLCHVASLPVILWNQGELICGSCHNIYLASRIPLLLGAFFPLDRSVWWFLETFCYPLSIRSVNSTRPYKLSVKTTFSLRLHGQLRCPYPKIQHPWPEYFRNVSFTGQFTSP